jgi:hypothetical protein
LPARDALGWQRRPGSPAATGLGGPVPVRDQGPAHTRVEHRLAAVPAADVEAGAVVVAAGTTWRPKRRHHGVPVGMHVGSPARSGSSAGPGPRLGGRRPRGGRRLARPRPPPRARCAGRAGWSASGGAGGSAAGVGAAGGPGTPAAWRAAAGTGWLLVVWRSVVAGEPAVAVRAGPDGGGRGGGGAG